MLNDKAQVMMLLKEAAARECLATALDVVTRHTRAGVPDWACIRTAIEHLLSEVRRAQPTAVGSARSQAR